MVVNEAVFAVTEISTDLQLADDLVQPGTEIEPSVLAASLSQDVFENEARNRKLILLKEISAAAIGHELAVTRFAAEGSHFVNPNEVIDPLSQLQTVNDFWKCAGETMPDPGKANFEPIAEALRRDPGLRLIAAPLMQPVEEIRLINEINTAYPLHPELRGHGITIEDGLYQRLLSNPESFIETGEITVGLRFKAPDDVLITWEEYVVSLRDAGQLIETARGGKWVFSAVNIKPADDHGKATVAEKFQRVAATITTGGLLMLHLIPQVAGMSYDPIKDTKLSNSGVYVLADGKPEQLYKAAGVRRRPDMRLEVRAVKAGKLSEDISA